MTRADLVDHLMAYGCEIAQFPEVNNSASVVKFRNPATGGKAYIDAPMDERPVKDYTVYRICTLLGVVLPDHVKYLTETHERVEKFRRGN